MFIVPIMRWNESVTLEFVKLYIKNECLWNPAHPSYKLRYKREQAYADISAQFRVATKKSLSIPEIKVKIKNLRTTYAQQVHKILQKSNPDSIYEPSLIWFHEMDRCLKHLPTNRHSTSYSTAHEAQEIDSSGQIWMDQELQNTKSNQINPDPLIPLTDKDFDTTRYLERKRIKNGFKKLKKKKIKHSSSSNIGNTSATKLEKEDEYDIYGKHIAMQLRKLGLQKALRVQLEIQNILSEARISDIP